MPEVLKHFDSGTQDGVLVLTIKDTHLHGDQLAEELRNELMGAVSKAGAKKLIVDFRNVEYLSSVAFRPLLSLRRKVEEAGGQMALCSLSPLVADVFRMLRLVSSSRSYPATFEVLPDLPAALAALKDK
jgi:anti-anti-sigma factor